MRAHHLLLAVIHAAMLDGMTAAIPVASQHETVEAILDASKRSSARAPLRWTFVQQRVAGPARVRPGPLAELVRRGREPALDQYLLLVAWASGGAHDVRRPAILWA